MPKPLLIALTILIAAAFTANVIVGYLDPARAIPAVNTIFGIVAGSLFALGQKDSAVAAIKSIQAKRAQSQPKPDDEEEDVS